MNSLREEPSWPAFPASESGPSFLEECQRLHLPNLLHHRLASVRRLHPPLHLRKREAPKADERRLNFETILILLLLSNIQTYKFLVLRQLLALHHRMATHHLRTHTSDTLRWRASISNRTQGVMPPRHVAAPFPRYYTLQGIYRVTESFSPCEAEGTEAVIRVTETIPCDSKKATEQATTATDIFCAFAAEPADTMK
ncbi:uncharacterized protein BDZ99DRAFT_518084 [Mytilinidion resinicola]|uniref:Uncharacterized protein n=1 Tax=Mytilinidion resinicola TaxID=574789 RepID=A0A6A6YUK8_9PEZI|nr:uncharacterized protein BDZ99DRAFT_518084 [Mytilinidion resinicola]KAF2812228.1 hypothetical protein BDZ99DRAFT_518084 [Mytilinidion resinicola]